MMEPIEGQDSLEAAVAASIGNEQPQAADPHCFLEQVSEGRSVHVEAETTPAEELFVRPLSDSLFDDDSELVLASDEEAVEIEASPLLSLAPLLNRPEPLTWVFAGARFIGDGRLVGEWFAEEWRTESGRTRDLVIDATWPECSVAVLKSHLKSRVVRHRPDIAVLLLDRSDAAAGIDELAQFERRLVGVLSVLAEIGAATVLVQQPLDEKSSDIDAEIYFEAVSGIARERGVEHFVLPKWTGSALRNRTPDSQARHAGLTLCQAMLHAIS